LFKRTVKYYTDRGSHIFACFIDFNKAFDLVNYWKLFKMLLNDGINVLIVRLLAYWYSNQEMCVRWHNSISSVFKTSNGTRQGGILSPVLFTRYINKVLSEADKSEIGCNLGGCFINILAYADDIVILAPAWRAMQKLLDIIFVESRKIDMSCNTKKTVCMVFDPKNRSAIVCNSFPQFKIGDISLQYVSQFKYLGHIIDNALSDNLDINREVRNMFYRTNTLVRKFSKCSTSVKVQLFKSYCICIYDAALWSSYNQSVLGNLRSCYIKCIKIFFKYSRRDSVTQMLFDLQLPSFDTVIINNRFAFNKHWLKCGNELIVKQCRLQL
jgi:hypothetical protein